MKKNIVIVGAGNLGRRHMQSLGLSVSDIQVTVVDPFEESLKLARELFDVSGISGELKTYSDIGAVKENIDVAIVATTASVRLPILRALLDSGTKYVVLEKVAFTSVQDIQDAKALVREAGATCWVNCPRRLYPFYNELEATLSNLDVQEFSVEGSDFGMACNGIHFIDLLAYLTGNSEYLVDMSEVSEIEESKRKGFYEFYGVMKGHFGNGTSFKLKCDKAEAAPSYRISFKVDGGSIVIDELAKTVNAELPDGHRVNVEFDMPYQSALTGPLVDSILRSGTCGLTTLEESMMLHSPFVEEAYRIYKEAVGENEESRVPIT